jgi:hypothetical protein
MGLGKKKFEVAGNFEKFKPRNKSKEGKRINKPNKQKRRKENY